MNWYSSNEPAGDESLRPRGWAGEHWSAAIGAEHAATRETAGLFDESSFAKMEIEGPGAAALMESLCDNRVARDVGRITYTQMLNSRGGIECDFTVARLDEERFSIVTGTAFGNHDREWIRKHLPEDGSAQVHDATSQWSCFGIWGPRARDVLQPLTPQDLGNEAFPYMSVRETTVGDVPVRALRVTYVGELGWELYCPTEYGMGLWLALWEAGRPHDMVAGGYRAIDSLRLEKGYRVWGADITPDETPYEGGVGFCVKLDKEDGFIGRDALVEAKENGPRTKLCCLLLEDPRSVALGNEPVRIGGEIRGRVTTGGYGYTVERSIAYAYLPPEHAEPGSAVEVEIFGSWIEGEVARRAAVRPEGRANPGLDQTRQDVLGPLDVLAHQADRGAGLAAAQQAYEPAVLSVRAREHLLRVGDPGDQLAHVPLHLGHGRHEPGRMGGLRYPDVEAHVRAAVLLEAVGGRHALDELVEHVQVAGLRALGGQDRGARLDRHPLVEHRAGVVAEGFLVLSHGERRGVRHEGAAGAPAQGDQVAALHERGQRLAQGRAGDAELASQVALGRQLATCGRAAPAGWRCRAVRRFPRRWWEAERA